jgi:hypothetical protein
MRLWFSPARPKRDRRPPRPAPSVRLCLESLEDRCLPAAVSTVASLTHDQIHLLQDQSQQQAAIAAIGVEVDQVVLAILQPFAPQVAQVRPLIATLTSAIPAQQAVAQALQNQSNLLNQLDDLQDQVLLNPAAAQALQPQIAAVEQQVSLFLP